MNNYTKKLLADLLGKIEDIKSSLDDLQTEAEDAMSETYQDALAEGEEKAKKEG